MSAQQIRLEEAREQKVSWKNPAWVCVVRGYILVTNLHSPSASLYGGPLGGREPEKGARI